MSSTSEGFLKCSLAPFDFASIEFRGIPDGSSCNIFSVHSSFVQEITVEAGKTMNILVAPSPGIACYMSPILTGESADFKPYAYPDVSQMFPANGKQFYVSDFRFVSNAVEITNTTPSISAGGVIKVMDLDLEMTLTKSGLEKVTPIWDVLGFPDSMDQKVYVDNVKYGMAGVCVNRDAQFDWTKIVGGEQAGEVEILMGNNDASLYRPAVWKSATHLCRGLDNSFTSKLIQIKAPADKSQTLFIKTMACVEYRPEPDTLLSQIATQAPQLDLVALQEYKKMVRVNPVAVRRAGNSGFFDFLKKAVKGVSGVLSHIPGPVGMISSGVNSLVS